MRWSDLLRKERVERWKTRWIVSYFDLYAREKNRRDFIGWNNNTWRGWVSMTEYAWNNNGRGIQTFRGGLLIYIYICLRAQYTVYTYTYPARKKTRQNGLCYFYDIREIRAVLINIIYTYTYTYTYMYIYTV